MKIFRNILLAIITFSTFMVYPQEEPLDGNYEIAVQNYTGQNIEVQLHPVSAVYRVVNNPYSPNFDKGFYSLTAKYRNFAVPPNYYDYINGVHYVYTTNGFEKVLKNQISSNTLGYQGWNDDFNGIDNGSFGTFGYGNYKLIIKNLETTRVDSCIIMLDYFSNYLSWGTPGDVYFYINPDNATHRFQYRFAAGYNQYIDVNYDTPDGYTLRSWAPNGLNNPLNRRPKKYGPEGGFELVDLPQTYNPDYFPLDSRKDCIALPLLNYNCDQNQDFPEQVPNEVRFDERQGIIPLNLTIKKKIFTPISQTTGYPANLLISIEPSVVFTIDKCPAPNPINSGFFLNPYQNTSNGNDLVLKSSISLDPDSLTTLILTSGTNYNENSRIRVRNNCKIIAENRSKIVLGDYSQIILERLENQTTQINSKLLLENNSNLVFGINSEINVNAYGELINEGGLIAYSQNSNAKIIIQSNGLYEIKPNVTNIHTVNNGGRILLQGGHLKIGDNSNLIFDGSTSFMQIDAGSSIVLGENAKIEFKNGAYLIANGSAISSAQGSHGWGIVLENAGEQTSITNCTFTNLKNSIFVKNTDSNYYGAFKNISNDTFYTDASCNYVIETKNASNITISNNHIYMIQGEGVGILMRYYINQGNEESASPTYAVNVMGNEISNGIVSAAFISFTNSYPYINFKYNYCYGSVSNTNIAYRQSFGNIKDNFIANSSGKNLDLIQAHPDVLSNTFESYIMNVTINDSYPYFAPISTSSDGGWVWRGGNNTLTSTSNGNIYYNNGNVLLDWWQNIFYKSYYNYHLQGRINEPSGVYYVRNNCFNGSNNPSSSLRDYYSDTTVVIPYYAGSNFACNTSDAGTIWSIEDLGNGFYDTLYRTDNNSGYQPEVDEGLYSSAIEKKLNDDNYGAVSTFKTLINLYPQIASINKNVVIKTNILQNKSY